MSKDITLKVQPSITVDAQVISDETAVLQVIAGAAGPPGPKYPADVPFRSVTVDGSVAFYELTADDLGKMVVIIQPGEEGVSIIIPDGLTSTVGDRIECVNAHLGSSPDMGFVAGVNSTLTQASDKMANFRVAFSHTTLTYIGFSDGFDNWYLHGDLQDAPI